MLEIAGGILLAVFLLNGGIEPLLRLGVTAIVGFGIIIALVVLYASPDARAVTLLGTLCFAIWYGYNSCEKGGGFIRCLKRNRIRKERAPGYVQRLIEFDLETVELKKRRDAIEEQRRVFSNGLREAHILASHKQLLDRLKIETEWLTAHHFQISHDKCKVIISHPLIEDCQIHATTVNLNTCCVVQIEAGKEIDKTVDATAKKTIIALTNWAKKAMLTINAMGDRA